MATVNAYTAAKVDELVGDRAPLNHTHDPQEVGITAWSTFSCQMVRWGASAATEAVSNGNGTLVARYMMIGTDTARYQVIMTRGSTTPNFSGQYIGFTLPSGHTPTSREQPGAACIYKAQAPFRSVAVGVGPQGAGFGYIIGLVADNGAWHASDGWDAGDVLSFSFECELA